jgi:hypothetical protein
MAMLDISAVLHTTSLRRRVHAGRVACPLLGEVDIERCLECSRLVRIEGGGGLSVVCHLPTAPAEEPEEW